MKNKTAKNILAALGYLWGGVMLTLLASLLVTGVYRMIDGGKGNNEYLVTGLVTLVLELVLALRLFYTFGYRRKELSKHECIISLLGGAGLHFLVSLPFHFSMYTAGVPALYLTEYIYRVNTPDLPPEMAFTDIPVMWLVLGFLAVEALTVLCAAWGCRIGQRKRGKESEALRGNG